MTRGHFKARQIWHSFYAKMLVAYVKLLQQTYVRLMLKIL